MASHIEHIPGIRKTFPRPPAPQRKRIGVVGLHEGRTLLTGLERATRAVAVAGCDSDPAKVESCRRERPDLDYTTDYGALLARDDIDVVAIYTPDPLHGEHVERAFEAAKDVICTKPLVNSMADARRILAAGRRTGRRLQVGQSTRFFEPFLRQRAAYERGVLGELDLVDAHYVHRMDWFYAKSPWAIADTDWVFAGLSHPLDLLRWYLGRIRQVQAYGRHSALARQHGVVGFDVYTVQVVAEDGCLGRALGHYGCHELPSARNAIELVLWGSHSTSQAQYHDMRHRYIAEDGTEVTEDPLYALRHHYFNSEVHGMHYGEFANYAEHFATALIDGTPNSPDLEEGVETFCVMEAARRAARTGRPVDCAPLYAEAGLEVD
ncbi:MAG: Gfo/Idh/MocA family oxidoreductase [Planctomycetes bacterium]|nr:Gfo/Idh/MocA family oxidoreductase [Planctomycetota bacterium]